MNTTITSQKYPVADWASMPDYSQADWRANPKSKTWWLQRLCFWTLEKLGCKHYRETVQRVTIDVEGLLPAIEAQYRNFEKRDFRHEPYFAICSYRDYNNAMNEIFEMTLTTLHRNVLESWGYRFPSIDFRGITLLFVPWYSGAPVLVPRRLFETKPIG